MSVNLDPYRYGGYTVNAEVKQRGETATGELMPATDR